MHPWPVANGDSRRDRFQAHTVLPDQRVNSGCGSDLVAIGDGGKDRKLPTTNSAQVMARELQSHESLAHSPNNVVTQLLALVRVGPRNPAAGEQHHNNSRLRLPRLLTPVS